MSALLEAADGLVEALQARRARPVAPLTEDQKAVIARFLEVNDQAVALGQRVVVGKRMAWTWLKQNAGLSCSRSAFEELVCDAFGRTSWSRK